MKGLDASVRQLVTTEITRVLDEREPQWNEVMHAHEVAEFLGVDRKTVYDYANRGKIPHQRLGKRLLFSRAALITWLGRFGNAEMPQEA